jgi:hypothetical protein
MSIEIDLLLFTFKMKVSHMAKYVSTLQLCVPCLNNVTNELKDGNRFLLTSIKFKGGLKACHSYYTYCDCMECECFEDCDCDECKEDGCEQECSCECNCDETKNKPYDGDCTCIIGECHYVKCDHYVDPCKKVAKSNREVHELNARICLDDKTCIMTNSKRRQLLKLVVKNKEKQIYLD